jgi:hypothetical protein
MLSPASATKTGKRFSSSRSMLKKIVLFGGPLDLENVEQAIEADSRPPEGSPIIPHIQIVLGADGFSGLRARWGR